MNRHESPGHDRPAERAEPFSGAPGRVGRDEFPGTACDRRHERDLRRPHWGTGRSGYGREDKQGSHGHLVVDHARSSRGDDEGRQTCTGRTDQSDDEEDPVASEALEHRACEHSRRDGRDHANRTQKGGWEDAASVEDCHEDHDCEGGIGRDTERPGDPETSNPVVRERWAQGRQCGSKHRRNLRHR